MIERELRGNNKEQLLPHSFAKKTATAIRHRARASKRDYKAELVAVDRQIDNVVDSLVSIGKSDALTAKLKELEAKRDRLNEISSSTSPTNLIAGADDKWREIVGNLEDLKNYAQPDEVERARSLLKQIIGEVEIREEPAGTFAYVSVQTAGGHKGGAEKRT